jgi:multidrug efflux pump subunit AcrB
VITGKQHTRLGDGFGARLHAARRRGYERTLDWALERKRLMVGVLLATDRAECLSVRGHSKELFSSSRTTARCAVIIRGDADTRRFS